MLLVWPLEATYVLPAVRSEVGTEWALVALKPRILFGIEIVLEFGDEAVVEALLVACDGIVMDVVGHDAQLTTLLQRCLIAAVSGKACAYRCADDDDTS